MSRIRDIAICCVGAACGFGAELLIWNQNTGIVCATGAIVSGLTTIFLFWWLE